MFLFITPEDIAALKECIYPVAAVVVLVLLDILSGIVKAGLAGELNSTKMRTGLGHKAAYFMLLILFMLVQVLQIHFEFWPEFPTVSIISALICVCETISVLENICHINPEIAEWPLIKELMEHNKEVNND